MSNSLLDKIKTFEDRFKKTPLGQWNEKHKKLILVTFFIVLAIAIYVFTVGSNTHQNIHH
jgi:hypothetical protein